MDLTPTINSNIVERIREFVEVTESQVSDTQILMFIAMSENLIKDKTGREFEIITVLDELHDGDGTQIVITDKKPIVEIINLKINDVVMSSDNYYVYQNTGEIVLKTGIFTGAGAIENGVFAPERQNLKISYRYGATNLEVIFSQLAFYMASRNCLIQKGIVETQGAVKEKYLEYSVDYGSVPYGGQIKAIDDEIKLRWEALGEQPVYGAF